VQCQLTKINVVVVGCVWSLHILLGEQSLIMHFWLGNFQMIQLLMLIVKTSKHVKKMLGLLYNSWLIKHNVIQNIVLIMYVGSHAGIVVSTT
jgi:hypothetical protein